MVEADLVIAGGGPDEDRVRLGEVDRLGLAERVRFAGWVTGEASGARSPGRGSRWCVAARDVRHGRPGGDGDATPVVAFDIPGLTAAGARRLPLAGAAFDVPGLADRIRAACVDPALAQAAGRAGRRFAAGFDWDVLADRQDEVPLGARAMTVPTPVQDVLDGAPALFLSRTSTTLSSRAARGCSTPPGRPWPRFSPRPRRARTPAAAHTFLRECAASGGEARPADGRAGCRPTTRPRSAADRGLPHPGRCAVPRRADTAAGRGVLHPGLTRQAPQAIESSTARRHRASSASRGRDPCAVATRRRGASGCAAPAGPASSPRPGPRRRRRPGRPSRPSSAAPPGCPARRRPSASAGCRRSCRRRRPATAAARRRRRSSRPRRRGSARPSPPAPPGRCAPW